MVTNQYGTIYTKASYLILQDRYIMETKPTDKNLIAHNQVKSKFTEVKLQQLCEIWLEKDKSLDMEKDMRKLC